MTATGLPVLDAWACLVDLVRWRLAEKMPAEAGSPFRSTVKERQQAKRCGCSVLSRDEVARRFGFATALGHLDGYTLQREGV